MANRGSKYAWIDKDVDDWFKNQARKIRESGLRADTVGVSRMLLQRVIIPNQVELTQLIRPKIRLNKKRWRKNDFIR